MGLAGSGCGGYEDLKSRKGFREWCDYSSVAWPPSAPSVPVQTRFFTLGAICFCSNCLDLILSYL